MVPCTSRWISTFKKISRFGVLEDTPIRAAPQRGTDASVSLVLIWTRRYLSGVVLPLCGGLFEGRGGLGLLRGVPVGRTTHASEGVPVWCCSFFTIALRNYREARALAVVDWLKAWLDRTAALLVIVMIC